MRTAKISWVLVLVTMCVCVLSFDWRFILGMLQVLLGLIIWEYFDVREHKLIDNRNKFIEKSQYTVYSTDMVFFASVVVKEHNTPIVKECFQQVELFAKLITKINADKRNKTKVFMSVQKHLETVHTVTIFKFCTENSTSCFDIILNELTEINQLAYRLLNIVGTYEQGTELKIVYEKLKSHPEYLKAAEKLTPIIFADEVGV